MAITRLVALAILSGGLFLGGCSTYVNIPKMQGDVARTDPNQDTVLQVEGVALRTVLNDRPVAGRFQIILPPGTDAAGYDTVAAAVSPDAVYAVDGKPKAGLYTLDARQVRVRGWFAEVDVVRPVLPDQPEGMQQLATVYLQWDPVNHWYVRRLRVWRVPVDEALRAAVRESEQEPR